MTQERVQKQKGRRSQDGHAEEASSDVTNAELAEKTDQVVSDIDDVLEDQLDEELLADIDSVLEKDAETFVAQYINQGGE